MNADKAPDWRDKLIAEYPSLFGDQPAHRSGRPETNDGWRELLEKAVQRLADAMKSRPGATLRIEQIKEKFGSLRLYVTGTFATDEAARCAVQLAIDLAEARSATTCETCGAEGRLHEANGWLLTACAEHARGTAVPSKPECAGLLIKRRYADGRLRIVSCRRYLRETDEFVDVDPASIGLED